MDLKNLLKDYWQIVTTIIFFVFIVGVYYTKIEYLNETILKNSSDIESLKKGTYVILGILQKDYPNINILEYTKTAQSKNLTSQETTNDLNKLKLFSPVEGKIYLMHKGFTKDQAEAVFYKSNF